MADSPGRLTATVIGAGAGGTLSIDALVASERYDLVGVADLSPASRERIEQRTGGTVPTFESYEEMLVAAPSDVVCVSTYAPSHLPITRAVLEAGRVRGMLVEKPLGEKTEFGRQILTLFRERRIPLVVPHGLMAQSAALQIIERVRSGLLGELRVVEMECTGWDLINAGIHWLQFFVALVEPSPIEMVLSAADSSTRTFRDGMQVETEAITMARAANGVRVLLNTGDRVPVAREDTPCLMRIVGSRGYIEFGAFEPHYLLVSPGHDREVVAVEPFAESAHRRHLEYLADQIVDGRTDYLIPETSLQALEIVEGAYLSNRIGASVALPLDGNRHNPITDWVPGDPYSGVGGGRNGREL
jgi:predicted dehydrogenase